MYNRKFILGEQVKHTNAFTVYLSDGFIQCYFQIEAFSSHMSIQNSTTKSTMF